MDNYTPVIVCAAILAVAAWKTGWLAKLRANVHPTTVRIVGDRLDNQAPRAAVRPTTLDEYDSATLGLAFQRAVKRDAEAALAAEMAAKSHAEALSRWQAPFAPPGVVPAPPPAAGTPTQPRIS